MEEIKNNISENIVRLRKANNMTQLELAEKLNYSDKAVSKWERGDGIPDALVLKRIADVFGVTVDEIMGDAIVKPEKKGKLLYTLLSRTNIIICSTILVWLVATVCFVLLKLIFPNLKNAWLCFVYAVPVSAIVLTVFNAIWGKRYLFIPILSVLIWSVAASLYLSFIKFIDIGLLFYVCIPLELLVIIFYAFKLDKKIKRKK